MLRHQFLLCSQELRCASSDAAGTARVLFGVLSDRQPVELLHLVKLPQLQLPQLLQQSAALDFIVVRESLLRLRLVIRDRVAPGGVLDSGDRLLRFLCLPRRHRRLTMAEGAADVENPRINGGVGPREVGRELALVFGLLRPALIFELLQQFALRLHRGDRAAESGRVLIPAPGHAVRRRKRSHPRLVRHVPAGLRLDQLVDRLSRLVGALRVADLLQLPGRLLHPGDFGAQPAAD